MSLLRLGNLLRERRGGPAYEMSQQKLALVQRRLTARGWRSSPDLLTFVRSSLG